MLIRNEILDHKGKLIDRVKIPGKTSAHISLRDDTIQCTDWKTNRRFMVKSVPQQLWPISTVFVMVLVMTFTNTTSRLSKIGYTTTQKKSDCQFSN
jgi:hypothetical protein